MDASYQAFVSTDEDSEDTPHESTVKIHIPPASKSKHIVFLSNRSTVHDEKFTS